MSILLKPYEISVWTDEWDSGQGKFIEKKLGIIGTHESLEQCRALEPVLDRDVNGQKKFSFKMYHHYIDNRTGEKTINPYMEWMISERKVKLKYEGRWYDFFIKNIIENSSNYLYTYELEDAIVNELSRNGYGVTLNQQSNNNIGNAQALASTVMEGTDWLVDSEVFVEKIEEGLVYLKTANSITATHILDQKPVNGKYSLGVTTESQTISANSTILAFYSCCTGKPVRFQFIYLPNLRANDRDSIKTDDKRIITESNCQYYIDRNESDYTLDSNSGLYLPSGFSTNEPSGEETLISSWYRGERYGYAPQSEYIPILNRYVSKYKNGTEQYYIYPDHKYISSKVIQNYLSSADFTSTAGWDVISLPGCETPATIELAYGRFTTDNKNQDIFRTALEDLELGSFTPDETQYKSYLKIKWGDEYSAITNSGLYDNRVLIGILGKGSKLALNLKYLNSGGYETAIGNVQIAECSYDVPSQKHSIDNSKIGYSTNTVSGATKIFNITKIEYNEETYKKDSKFRVILSRPEGISTNEVQYIAVAELYPAYFDDEDRLITLDNQTMEGKIIPQYHVFTEEDLKGIHHADQLSKFIISSLSGYQPVYNSGAEKIRSVEVSESNYFNNLSSIAERFEAWLDFDITRDGNGGITNKVVRLKNYCGEEKFSGIRYGVNLKDISRTYASQSLATKLIVKNNKNELAENGMCTISKADANETGENYLYDFQYYIKKGLMPSAEYFGTLYANNDDEADNADMVFITLDNTPNHVDNFDDALNTRSVPLTTNELNDLSLNEVVSSLSSNLEKKGKWTASRPTVWGDDTKEADFTLSKGTGEGAYSIKYQHPPKTGEADKLQTICLTAWLTKEIYTAFEVEASYSTPAIVYLHGSDKWHKNRLSTDNYVAFKNSEGTTIAPIRSFEDFDFTLNGYYPRVKKLNLKYLDFTDSLNSMQNILTKKSAELEVQKGMYQASETKIQDNIEDFSVLTGILPTEIHASNLTKIELSSEVYADYNNRYGYSNYDDTKALISITIPTQTNENNENIVKLSENGKCSVSISCTFLNDASMISAQFYPILILATGTKLQKDYSLSFLASEAEEVEGKKVATKTLEIDIVDITAPTISRKLKEYTEYNQAYYSSKEQAERLQVEVEYLTEQLADLKSQMSMLLDLKAALNKLFYHKYYRFIQEGTWISEEHVDHNKYYYDAQSVLYNSCFPQVAYNINVIAIDSLEEYKDFAIGLGDRTYVEDPDFFESGEKEKVVVTHLTNHLQTPDKDQIKVQNFRDQFQNLFQKITATVQQVQYSTGAYERAAALVEAAPEQKMGFLDEALSAAEAKFSVAGQQSVVSDESGITITDLNSPSNQLKMIGGAIMLSQKDKSGEQKWTTGLTSEGISASLVTAGTINTGSIQIMTGGEPTFRWDEAGISAYDYEIAKDSKMITRINSRKFVRFDKNGLYGINGSVDGLSFLPHEAEEIDKNATFALTWEGLKVTSNNGISLRIGNGARSGKYTDSILAVTNDQTKQVMVQIDSRGALTWNSTNSPTQVLYHAAIYKDGALVVPSTPADGTLWSNYPDGDIGDTIGWHRKLNGGTDKFASYTYNGGADWTSPILIGGSEGQAGAGIVGVAEYYYATSDPAEEPENPDNDENKEYTWETNISKTGFGESKIYLWNCEGTTLSNGDTLYTQPILLMTYSDQVVLYECYTCTDEEIDGKDDFKEDYTLPTLTKTEEGWTLGSGSAWICIDAMNPGEKKIPKPDAEKTRLWNYEAIGYANGEVAYSGPSCIGTMGPAGPTGNGITEVTNWYKVTLTNSAPDSGGAERGWYDTAAKAYDAIEDANDKVKYLWNYEQTWYTNGDDTETSVALVTSSVRSIDTITEYYQVTDGSDPTPITYDGSDDPPVVTGWYTDIQQPSSGEVLWNCEVIKYTFSDENNTLYSVTSPAKIGYVGRDGIAYSFSLDNDFDTIVKSPEGTFATTSISIGIIRKKGEEDANGIGTVFAKKSWVTYVDSSRGEQLTSDIYTIEDFTNLPDKGKIDFTWYGSTEADAPILGSKNFNFQVVTSSVDYDFAIPKTVFNSSQSGGSFDIIVQKWDLNGVETYESYEEDLPFEVQQWDELEQRWISLEEWQITYDIDASESLTFRIITNSEEGGILVWDQETIEFTHDGADGLGLIEIKFIDGQTPSKSDTEWASYPGEKVTWENIANVGECQEGAQAFIVGIVEGKYSSAGVNQTVQTYGKITKIDNNKVTIEHSSLIWGGTKGDDATAAYTIDLSTERTFVSTGSDKHLDTTTSDYFTVGLFIGTEKQYFELSNTQLENTWTIVPKKNDDDNLFSFVINPNDKTITWTWEADTDVSEANLKSKHSITLELYNGTEYITNKTYEVVKQYGGSQGEQGPAGADKFNCYVESSIGNFYKNTLPENTEITFTAKIFQGLVQIDESGEGLTYTWYKDNAEVSGENKKWWATTLGNVKDSSISFSAE